MISVERTGNKTKITVKDSKRPLIVFAYKEDGSFGMDINMAENHVVVQGMQKHRLYEQSIGNVNTMLAFLALLGEKTEDPIRVHDVIDPDAKLMKNAGDLLEEEVYCVLTDHYFLSTPQSVKQYLLLRGELFVGYESTRDEDLGKLRYITRKCNLEDFITKYNEARG